ncbi:MAG TPA: tryptophan--tRNA ligase [Candidatus Brocadiia bacterium]|nr:tryptophan--tRNA ligase [Candidatus Brocadiia bacterium]
MTKKKVAFSGIQPSGDIHVGNYLGAIKNWARMIDEVDCIFCIVDLHAITVMYDPAEMQERILRAAAVNIACGLDPARCRIFVQSRVPEHTELCWLLNTVTPIGSLERMTQFKDKSQQQQENVNTGLFDYPVLMAADIMLYKANVVPVGDDQLQHLELCREIVRKFNARFGDVFPEPQERLSQAPRIMGLDGKAKMSKSLGNHISLIDEPDAVWKKLAPAFTDPARQRRSDPGNPDICNIFTMHRGFSPPEVVQRVNGECRGAEIGCVECKKMLLEHMLKELEPIRTRAKELIAEPERVYSALSEGAAKCGTVAEATMDEVRRAMGLRK